MILPRISNRRMFGRAPELQLLHDSRRALSGRRGSLVLVGGEAGIGKTRLLAEFTLSLRGGRAPHCAFGEALEDAPRPFGPFRSALAALVTASPQTLRAAEPVVRRALGALIPDALVANGYAAPARERLEKAELFTGILRYCAALTDKRATVIVLEDLHWADSATLELLCHLAPRIGGLRLLIVGSYRDDEVTPSHRLFSPLARLAREATVRRAVLEPLGDRDVRALIADALGTLPLSRERAHDIVAGCDGNPFFAEEMLKHAIESESSGRLAPLPISIRALTLERIASLDTAERGLLDYAAVLGRQFAASRLAAATGRPLEEVIAVLRRLRDVGVLVEEAHPLPHLRFRHALVRQIIYGELPPDTARSMHARVVAILEHEPERDHDALAYHAWRARLRERTIEYSEIAGDAALAVRAAAQAATYYERVLELVDDEEARIRLLGKNGEAWLQQSDFARAVSAYMALYEILVARKDYDGAARALARAAAEDANAGRIREALHALTKFQAAHGERLTRAAADHLSANIARIATAGGDFELAQRALANVPDPGELEAFTHQVYWLARLFRSEHALDGEDWLRAANELERGNPRTYPLMRAQMLHSIASTSITFAENDVGERAADEAIAIDREFGFFRALAFANAVKACILGVRGRLAAALSCGEAALDEPELFVARLELALGASPVALAAGDYDLARRLLDEGFGTTIRQAGMESAAALFDGMRAALLFALGRVREARALFDQSVMAPQHPFAVVYFWPFATQHATDEQRIRLRGLCAALAVKPAGRVARACLALVNGDAESAAALYRELGWPLHEADALERAGRAGEALAIHLACGAVSGERRLRLAADIPASTGVRKDPLSRREREVARMIARGFTNRGIAEELCVTEKTIEKHVTSIYAKCKFSTRAQLAAYVVRQTEP